MDHKIPYYDILEYAKPVYQLLMTTEFKQPKLFKYKETYWSIHISKDLCILNPCKLGTYCVICYPSLQQYILPNQANCTDCVKGTKIIPGYCFWGFVEDKSVLVFSLYFPNFFYWWFHQSLITSNAIKLCSFNDMYILFKT